MDKINLPELITPSQKVAIFLRKEIQREKYAVGDRLTNERLLADKLSVTRGTVRKALKILEQERLIVRKHGHGTFVTSPVSAKVHNQDTALIGYLVFGVKWSPHHKYFFGPILDEVSILAASQGYVLSTGYNTTEESESCHVEAFLKNKIKGLIFAPCTETSQKVYTRVVKENIPVVLLDVPLSDSDEDFVGVNDYHGTKIATRHLIELGHTRIAYLGHSHPELIMGQLSRKMAFLNACATAGLTTPPEFIIEEEAEHIELFSEFDLSNLFVRLKKLLNREDRPTAIVAYNDLWAEAAIRIVQETSLKIPSDLSIVGFDNAIVNSFSDLPLTTVDPKPNEIARQLLDMLMTKIENPDKYGKRSILINPELIIRESTTIPPQ